MWYEYCLLQLSFDFHCHGVPFPFPHFQSVYIPRSELGLMYNIYTSCFYFCIQSASLYLLVGAFNLFMFKVTLNMYILIVILLLVLNLWLSFFFPLMIRWLYLVLWLYCFFLLCMYPLWIFIFWFPCRFDIAVYIHAKLFSVVSLNFKCISNILYMCCLLTVAGFDTVFVCGWFLPLLSVFLYWWDFPFGNFLFLLVAFLSKEVPLAFDIKLFGGPELS